jgi:hypothetical protein
MPDSGRRGQLKRQEIVIEVAFLHQKGNRPFQSDSLENP